MKITSDGKSRGVFAFDYDPALVDVARGIPGHRKFNRETKQWEFKLSRASLDYLRSKLPDIPMCAATERYLDKCREKDQQALKARSEAEGITAESIRDYRFKTAPFNHQAEVFLRSRDLESFALLMEQGTGKTKVALDTIAYLHVNGRCDSVLVVTPNSVKTNWITDEIPNHLPDYVEVRAAYWESTPKKAERHALERLFEPFAGLRVLTMNHEALSHERPVKFAERFLKTAMKSMVIIDESTSIKTPGKKRTRAAIRLGKMADYRRIMTGTPVTKSPIDLYSQFAFLDPDILGHSSFYSYRNEYCVMGGYEHKQIISYKNLDQLTARIEAYSYRKLKKDCLDLPEKLYQRLKVPLTPEQKALYDEMAADMRVQLGEEKITATIALTKLLKLQQITSGFITDDEGNKRVIAGKNQRLAALVELLENHGGKAIIWSRFTHDIETITEELNRQFGAGAARAFYGAVKSEERTEIRQEFQKQDSALQFFVGNPQAGGTGLTLTEANLVVYYANSFDLEHRLQSEDRAHRIGQVRNVTYVDIIAPGTMDAKIVQALRDKKGIADMINQDGVSDWI